MFWYRIVPWVLAMQECIHLAGTWSAVLHVDKPHGRNVFMTVDGFAPRIEAECAAFNAGIEYCMMAA